MAEHWWENKGILKWVSNSSKRTVWTATTHNFDEDSNVLSSPSVPESLSPASLGDRTFPPLRMERGGDDAEDSPEEGLSDCPTGMLVQAVQPTGSPFLLSGLWGGMGVSGFFARSPPARGGGCKETNLDLAPEISWDIFTLSHSRQISCGF